MNFFASVPLDRPDPIFGLNIRFREDPRPNKIDLGAGVYRTAELKPFILKSVKRAEAHLLETEKSKDYLPIDGLPEYISLTKKLVFGRDAKKIYGAHTPGATVAIRVGGAFLKELGIHKAFLSNPTWANHVRIFQHAGLEVGNYTYLNFQKLSFHFEGFIEDLKKMERGCCVLLHACCHNPTGFDPSIEQWKTICNVIKEKEIFPFFDLSYQGFGDQLETDVAAVRLFLEEGLNFAVAVSHSKNFSLYAERCGALFMICNDEEEVERVGSRIKIIIRGLYSNPPCHGARIVSTILQHAELHPLWINEVAEMRTRLVKMRHSLAELLQGKFDFISRQKGMFSYTGLSRSQVEKLISEFGIYLPEDGRINIAGLNLDNLHYVANAILNTL
jgi:aromatic-amino-acid transaminase